MWGGAAVAGVKLVNTKAEIGAWCWRLGPPGRPCLAGRALPIQTPTHWRGARAVSGTCLGPRGPF
jgi:hypothetical protein